MRVRPREMHHIIRDMLIMPPPPSPTDYYLSSNIVFSASGSAVRAGWIVRCLRRWYFSVCMVVVLVEVYSFRLDNWCDNCCCSGCLKREYLVSLHTIKFVHKLVTCLNSCWCCRQALSGLSSFSNLWWVAGSYLNIERLAQYQRWCEFFVLWKMAENVN